MAKKKQHKTGHYVDPDAEGNVIIYCETCPWRARVGVADLSWNAAMAGIFAARDAHEGSPTAPAAAPSSSTQEQKK